VTNKQSGDYLVCTPCTNTSTGLAFYSFLTGFNIPQVVYNDTCMNVWTVPNTVANSWICPTGRNLNSGQVVNSSGLVCFSDTNNTNV
jgi:hypothetical protein